ncbi:EVI5-like protein [Lamellibrachia satsuma]|nr:EVI5-like protein [Lamellibrachia satsuma]
MESDIVAGDDRLEKEYSTLKSKEQEEQVELRRLRTENRLLRQRIENMEKETSTLADRLIHDQVRYAKQEEEVFILKRDLSCTRQTNEKATQKLNEARAEYEELKQTSSKAPSPEHMANTQKMVHDLQEELAVIKVREAEAQCTIHELHARIRELENAKNELQREPSEELRHLQEELVACKLREAEANLSMKELRQKVKDVERHWEKYQQRYGPDATSKPSKNAAQHLAEEVMGVRLREAEAVAELKETKQRVMELETQNHIYDRQVKRLDTDKLKLEGKLEEADAHSTQLNNHIQDLDRQINKFESKMKEDSMMTRITNAEYSQNVAEMRQRIAELEIENQELVTASQLSNTGDHQELTSRISDLQEEVMQLKMARRIQGLSQAAVSHLSFDTGSDYDTDDIEATVASSLIKLTDSMGPEDASVLLGHAVRPRLNELDSSEGEVFAGQEGRPKRRVHKKKRRSVSNNDLDKTPTQDSINKDFHTVFKDIDSLGNVPCSDESTTSEPIENGIVESDTANNSIAGSGDSVLMTTAGSTLDDTLTESVVAVNGDVTEVVGHSETDSAGH